ncbi:MAG: acyltransferase [Actinobacteria bacterium]|nr:acyltransferase [Actinomycetota bacterium]
MRGLGVLAVMAGHAFRMGTLSFSGVVDLFFVISGALITTLLLQEHRDTGDVNVRKFYARRLFRLLPGLWVMLGGAALVGIVLKLTDNMGVRTLGGLAKEMFTSVFYIHNIVYPFNDGPWVDHLWTLSVEEQFYLLIGIVALIFIVKGRIKAVTWLLVAMVAYIQITRLFLWAGPLGVVQAAAWNQRPDALMVGMLVAIASAHVPDPIPAKHQRLFAGLASVSVLVFVFTIFASTGWARSLGVSHDYAPKAFQDYLRSGERPPGFYWIQWGHTAAAWSSAVVAFCMFRVPTWRPNKALSWKPLVFVGGALSYPLYLWHIPLQELVHPFLPDGTPLVVWGLIAITVPFVAAYPSYRFVETKALVFKDRFSVTGAVKANQAKTNPAKTPPGATPPGATIESKD